jgi:hypothetical protein
MHLLRFLIPVAKLYTAKQAIAVASETVEAFGGAGYVEDTGIPRLLRDAQVLSIWEGTTNVLSLDTLRAVGRVDALGTWAADIRARVAAVRASASAVCVERVSDAVERIEAYAAQAARSGREFQEAGARAFSFAIARTEAAALLIEHAATTADDAATTAAKRWCSRELASLVEADEHHRAASLALADPDHRQ